MKRAICKFLLNLLGWTAVEPPIEEPKALILGVPHTSGWDFLISFLYYESVEGKAFVMVKKEFFWGPLAPIMRWMGGVPVDRKRGATVAKQMIDAINNTDRIHLAIAPEGTRQRTERWKTGFHTIARACNIPVYMGYFDWGTKRIGRGVKIELTDNAQEDLIRIREHYKKLGVVGKHPENFAV